MSEAADRIEMARGWWELATESLANAEHDAMLFPAGAVSRAYYACFYAASALLLCEGRHFVKHTGVRAALHEHLVRTGRLAPELGQAYDELLKSRQIADYGALNRVTTEEARRAIDRARLVIEGIERLLPGGIVQPE